MSYTRFDLNIYNIFNNLRISIYKQEWYMLVDGTNKAYMTSRHVF